jgi:hypothetical protein
MRVGRYANLGKVATESPAARCGVDYGATCEVAGAFRVMLGTPTGLGRAWLGQSSGVAIGPPRIQGQVSPGSQHQDVAVSHTPPLGFGARRELTLFPARPRVLAMLRTP